MTAKNQTIDIEVNGKPFILELFFKDNIPVRIELTECSQDPDSIEMLEAYEFRNVEVDQ